MRKRNRVPYFLSSALSAAAAADILERAHTAADEIINLLALLFIASGVQLEKLPRASAL